MSVLEMTNDFDSVSEGCPRQVDSRDNTGRTKSIRFDLRSESELARLLRRAKVPSSRILTGPQEASLGQIYVKAVFS